MSQEKSLKKALHRTIFKAMGKPARAASATRIVNDLQDENSLAQVPENSIPASREPVLHKDISVSEMHQQKQMNAQAALGQPLKAKKPAMSMRRPVAASAPAGGGGPKGPKLPAMPKIGKAMGGAMLQSEAPKKGVEMLKNFMERSKGKKVSK